MFCIECWCPEEGSEERSGEGRILYGSKKEMEPLQCDGQDLKTSSLLSVSVYKACSVSGSRDGWRRGFRQRDVRGEGDKVSGRRLVFVQVLKLPLPVSVTCAGLSVRQK